MQSSGQRRVAPEAPDAGPTLKVAAVARRLGVAPATLRTWARRYGLGPPAHTAGAHRQYTADDLSRLLVMRRLTLEGVAPAEAARLALATPLRQDAAATVADVTGLPVPVQPGADGVGTAVPAPPDPEREPDQRERGSSQPDPDQPDPDQPDPDQPDPDQPDPDQPEPKQREPDQSERGSGRPDPTRGQPGERKRSHPEHRLFIRHQGRTADDAAGTEVAARTPAAGTLPGRLAATPAVVDIHGDLSRLPKDARRLLHAARDLDSLECRRQLRSHLESRGVVETWEQVNLPALRALGDFWVTTGAGCEVERVLSEAATAALHEVLVSAEPPMWGTALLACTQDEHHALPLHALAAALSERRVATVVLGAAVPHRALADATERLRPKVLVLYAVDAVPADQLDALFELEQKTRLLVGGPGWRGQQVPDGAVHAPSLRAAVDQVRLAVRH